MSMRSGLAINAIALSGMISTDGKAEAQVEYEKSEDSVFAKIGR